MPELLKTDTISGRIYLPTCDVYVHYAGASADAVGRVTDIRPSQVVGHRALEEESVVLDLHVTGQGAIQAVVGERQAITQTP